MKKWVKQMPSKSDIYAERDGITVEHIHSTYRSYKVYHIPCAKCGRIVKKRIYNGDKDYYCDVCKLNLREKEKALEHELLDSILSKGEQRFLKAKGKVLEQVKNPDEYTKAIGIAETRADLYGSIPEAMVAIELIKLGYSIIPQQKVGRYKVDFAIPKEKLIVEVDGGLYHKDINSDRDNYIKLCIGLDWEIVHVPAEWISKDIRRVRKVLNEIKKK